MENNISEAGEENKAAQSSVYAERECELRTCPVLFTPKRAGEKFHSTDCRVKYHTPVKTVGKEAERFETGTTREAVIKQIINHYPSIPCAHINIPSTHSISGRNRLAELSKEYEFTYHFVDGKDEKGQKSKFYDMSTTTLERFREILEEEQARTIEMKAGAKG